MSATTLDAASTLGPRAGESAIAAARSAILAALAAGPQTSQPWRRHRYPPRTVAGPCLWIDDPTLGRDGAFVTATFPVILMVDGDDAAQAAALDEGIAQAYDALLDVESLSIVEARPYVRDVGTGTPSRLYVLAVAVPVTADTLCSPRLREASTSGPDRDVVASTERQSPSP